MSETRDKRLRTDLDQFILALIDNGVSTPYTLQKAAGLSLGATVPALQRLLEARLVRHGKPGSRGRTDYQVTAAGKRLLKGGWLPLIEEGPSGDVDSDLRVALLALWGGRGTSAGCRLPPPIRRQEDGVSGRSRADGQSGQAASSATLVQRPEILNRQGPPHG